MNDTCYLGTIPASDVEDIEVICLGVTFDLYKSYLGQFDLKKLSFFRACQSEGDSDTIVLEPVPKERFAHLAEKAGLIENGRPARAAPRPAVAAEQTLLSAPEPKIEEFTPQFAAMWDARKEAITSYLFAP